MARNAARSEKRDGRRLRRDRTEAKLVATVGRLIARKGPEALGVNAIAQAAGVDKVLIYRYFGDLGGLLRRYGESVDFWPTLDEVLGPDRAVLRTGEPPVVAANIVAGFGRALRRRPATLQLMAWECAHRNELTTALEEARERWNEALFAELRAAGLSYPPALGAVSVVLAAGVGYLAMRGRDIHVYGGLDVGTDDGWRAIEGALVDFLAGRT